MKNEIIAIIEDRAYLDLALRIILEAAETKELPKEEHLPVFNDELTGETFEAVLEAVTGKKY
jgi:hypothetical protein